MRILRVVLMFVMLIIYAASVQAAGLVVNPGFESGSINGSWIIVTQPVTIDSTVSCSGGYSAKMSSLSSFIYCNFPNGTLKSSTEYKFTTWIKASNAEATLVLSGLLNDPDTQAPKYVSLGTYDWTKITFTFKTGDNVTGGPIYFTLSGSSMGNVWIDDTTVTRQYVNNPGFESGSINGSWGVITQPVVIDDTVARLGSYSAKMSALSSFICCDFPNGILKPSTEYEFSTWIKCANANATLVLSGLPNDPITQAPKYVGLGTYDWSNVNFKFKTGDTVTGGSVYFTLSGSSMGNVWIDDTTLIGPDPIYDVVTDWSIINNPSGQWSYGFLPTSRDTVISQGTFTPYNDTTGGYWSYSGQAPWRGLASLNGTNIFLAGGWWADYVNEFVYQSLGTIKWTAPADGEYRIVSSFKAYENSSIVYVIKKKSDGTLTYLNPNGSAGQTINGATSDVYSYIDNVSMMSNESIFFAEYNNKPGLLPTSGSLDNYVTLNAAAYEVDSVKYNVSSDGRNLNFTDSRSGINYLNDQSDSYFAYIIKNNTRYNSSQVSIQNDLITATFGSSNVTATIRFKSQNRYITMEVVSVSDNTIDELTFVNIPLNLNATMDESFGGSVLALNLKTNVVEQPGLQSNLVATCYPRFGMVGAKAAIIGCKPEMMRSVIKDVMLSAPDLPKSTKGGPWALDEGSGRRPYAMVVGGIRTADVSSWISMCNNTGLSAIDFHTGNGWLKYGTYTPYPSNPDAINELKSVITSLHAAGLQAYFHVYSLCIAKDTSYVTPVPDSRLSKKLKFNLSAAITSDATTINVTQSTVGMSPNSMYGSANTTTLQIDNELITFTGVNTSSPYGFTGCVRGAYGTTPSAHSANASVYELDQVFDLFMPNPDTTLFTEMAQRIAYIYNECNFDGFYFDAIDGTFIIDGWEDAWHHASKFVFEVAKNIDHPGVFDYSAFWHHFWYLRSREGSLDVSRRGHKKFIDAHTFLDKTNERILLPATLGWFSFYSYNNSIFPEPTFADDVEYLTAKAAGYDWGLTLSGMTPSIYSSSPIVQRLSAIVKNWQDLRALNLMTNAVKAKLKVKGDDFKLNKNAAGNWQITQTDYIKHKVEATDTATRSWTSNNRFASQPVKLRIEGLASTTTYDNSSNVTITDFSNISEFSAYDTTAGVSSAISRVTTPLISGSYSGRFAAYNNGQVAQNAWTMVGKSPSSTLNMSNSGLGVWIYGDNRGEIINFQFTIPSAAGSGRDDHYIKVDFSGWKYFELVEPEADRITEYGWPYMTREADWSTSNPWAPIGGSYNVYMPWSYGTYRQTVDTFSIWYNNLPSDNTLVECFIGPVKALPLSNVSIQNPAITINGNTVTFPCDLTTGYYIEYSSMTDCKLYAPNGTLYQNITPTGVAPTINNGANTVTFSNYDNGNRVRARVTVITQDTPMVQ